MLDMKGHQKDADKPYLHLKYVNGKTEVKGASDRSLGRKVEDLSESKEQDGVFLDWSWDGVELTVRNDRYGMYPLFYTVFDNEIVISSGILPLLNSNVPKDLDYACLAILFRIGHVIGNDTPFKHIRTLPANSQLRWCAGKITLETKKVKGCFDNSQRLSYDDAVEGYSHYFSQAMLKRLPDSDNFTVPISGGRDSRNILFELNKHNANPKRCVTLRYRPPATNEDERIAGLICQRLGIEHDIINKPENWFDAVAEDIYLTNFCGGGHSWSLPLASYFEQHSFDTIYDGLAGGIISSGQTIDQNKDKLFRENRLQELALILLNEAQFEGFNQHAFHTSFYKKIPMELAVSRLVEELSTHVDSGNPALSYTFWNRTRRAVGAIPYSIMSGVRTVHCPYLDHAFFDFCTGLDSSFILGRPFHDDVIKFSYPDLADIPYENKALKANYDKVAKDYYQKSVKDFGRYLVHRGINRSSIVKNQYSYARMFNSLLLNKNEQPWYLRRILYCYELDKFLG